MKDLSEVILLFEKTVGAPLSKFIDILNKEGDTAPKKVSFRKMLENWIKDFETLRDGQFDSYDDNLISDEELQGAVALEEPPENLDDTFGIKPSQFDEETKDPDDLPPETPEEQGDNDLNNDEDEGDLL